MKTISTIFLFCICLTSLAQEDKRLDYFPEMSRAAGVSFQKFDGLNNRIANYPQYKQIRNATGVLQLGTFHERHQFISQANLMGGSSMSGDPGQRSSTIRYLGAAVDFGYDFIKSEKVALFPLVGIGYQFYQARFFRDNSSVDFNSVVQSTTVQNNLSPLNLTNGFVNYRAGIGFAARSAKHGCSIGVQAVYTGSFHDRSWRSNDNQTLNNAPTDKLSQVYAGLVFTCRPFFMMHRGRM